MDEGNILNEVLQRTLDFVNRGFGLIEGEVYWLFGALLVINLTLAGLTWATSQDDVLIAFARRVLFVGFVVWLVAYWPAIVDTLGLGFVKLGFRAGDAPGMYHDFYNPGLIVATGWGGAWTMVEATNDLTGIRATFANFPQILILLAAAGVYFVAFALIAFQVFLALVQFKVGALASFILLPMALLNKTAFLTERPIGWVFASGVRLMVMALVMALGADLVERVVVTEDMTIRQAVAAALGAVTLFLLARMAATMATDLVQGSPSLWSDGSGAIGPARRVGVGAAGVVGSVGQRTADAAGRVARLAAVKAASAMPGGAVVAHTASTAAKGLQPR